MTTGWRCFRCAASRVAGAGRHRKGVGADLVEPDLEAGQFGLILAVVMDGLRLHRRLRPPARTAAS